MVDISTPLYMQIYNHLLDEIQARKYGGGKKLPTEKELSQNYHVSRITSKKALDMLADENVIIRIKGKGSYISPDWNKNASAGLPGEDKGKRVVGVIMPDFADSFGRDILISIERQCRKNNLFCVFSNSYGDQRREEKVLEDLTAFNAGGIIIMPVHGEYYNGKILQLILSGFPIVVIDRDMRGIPSCFVGTDNVAAAETAIDYLVKAGHKKIGVYSPNINKTSSLEDRMEGINKSLWKNEIPIDPALFFTQLYSTLPNQNTLEAFLTDRDAVVRHIGANKDMTAAFAMEYNIALIIKSAADKLGLSVPGDLSIMCFDSTGKMVTHSDTLTYEFSHMRQNQSKIGERAFEVLYSIMLGEIHGKPVKITLQADMELGVSTSSL